MSNLGTHYHFRLDFQKVDQHSWGNRLIHSTKHRKDNQLQSQEVPCRYPSRESKHGIKEPEGNMFNPIFKGNVQVRKHPGMCAFAELELLSYRKPKHVVQNKKNGHKIPIIVTTLMMKLNSISELVKGTHNDTQHQCPFSVSCAE